ncbi:MAG TPA: PAS domain-containing protein, partial [Urbifossiella sp.]|nr:PAS domain-containing protein [Urbifossiella sp.]
MTASENGTVLTADAPAGLLASTEFLQAAFSSIQANILIADPKMTIVYINDRARETLRTIEDAIQTAFGVDVDEILAGSIHRFHKDKRRVERILRNPAALPHVAEFAFGGVALQARINAIFG